MRHSAAVTRLLTQISRVLANPARLFRRLLMAVPNLPLSTRVALDLFDRPHYAYAVKAAADQAKALGVPSITAIELGVGTGRGLLALERIAQDVAVETGVGIEVVGFDAGSGLRPPADWRGPPYLYPGGFYSVEETPLRARVSPGQLGLSDARRTLAPL